MKRFFGFAVAAATMVSVNAASISNGDFETDARLDGVFTGTITGWTGSNFGIFNPTDGLFNPGQVGGNNYGFINTAAGTFSQNLTGENSTLTANIQYTVTARVGQRTNGDGTDFEVALVANGNTLASRTQADITLSAGNFTALSFSFTPDGGNANLGQQLSIVLNNDGATQIGFDDVTISAVAVPEPTTYALISGLGLVGMAAYRRHKLRQV